MKSYFNDLLKSSRFVLVLSILVLLLGIGVYYSWQALAKGEVELSKLQAKRTHVMQLRERAARNEELLANNLAVLRQYEERIPHVDGYVWLNKFLKHYAPEAKITVDPPEIGYELIAVPDYCTGLFRLQGASTIGHLTDLLREFETRLPFANVEEVQIHYVDANKEQVKFSMNLLMIMRLHQAPASNLKRTIASK